MFKSKGCFSGIPGHEVLRLLLVYYKAEGVQGEIKQPGSAGSVGVCHFKERGLFFYCINELMRGLLSLCSFHHIHCLCVCARVQYDDSHTDRYSSYRVHAPQSQNPVHGGMDFHSDHRANRHPASSSISPSSSSQLSNRREPETAV